MNSFDPSLPCFVRYVSDARLDRVGSTEENPTLFDMSVEEELEADIAGRLVGRLSKVAVDGRQTSSHKTCKNLQKSGFTVKTKSVTWCTGK